MTQFNSITPGMVRQNASAANGMPRLDPQQTLANRLAERLGLDKGSLNGKADDFAPAKVAERILGFIGGRLESQKASGADTTQLQKMYDQAAKGVEQGFKEARKILDGMGVLAGNIAADIDQTYDLIQSGLADIAERLLPQPAEQTPALSANASRLEAQSQTFDLSVTTREGDKLRISVAQASASMSNSQVDTGGNRVQGERIQVGGWQVDIEGDLNDQEREALNALLGQVQELADAFYSGDYAGAFDRALELNLDGSQLASMSLNLTQTSMRQVSETYGRVAGQDTPSSAVNSDLRDYAAGLLEAMRQSNELTSSPSDLLRDLLKGGFAMDERFDQGRLDKAMSLNDLLLEGLKGQVEQPAEQAKTSE
ncbi:DUF5610 domain-containing protein [Halopseudomonas pelagia]|uniref:DUF5610 domain-containing protein n=1 Tax=Halopseudomonas pelagia TaxID=553151 RepID=UPI00058F43AE|nr:DUF5610 domain-containing protein [Halopseudomonas pelagia]